MILKRYSSYIKDRWTEQAMEFTFTRHLIICLDKSASELHVAYRYSDPERSFLDELKYKKHVITRLEDQNLAISDGDFNDLCFSVYETDDWEGLDLDSCYMSCSIGKDKLTDLALRLDDISFRVWDDIYRAPGEPDDDETHLESLQITWNDLHGFCRTIAGLKQVQSDVTGLDETGPSEATVAGFLAGADALAAELGIDLNRYDKDGILIPEQV